MNRDSGTRFRLSLAELIPLCLLLVVVTFVTTRAIDDKRPAKIAPRHGGADELEPLERQYGPGNNSQHGEEWMVRDFFRDKRNGIFVDVGARNGEG